MTFVRGQSGNPAGRPIGSRNRKALIVEGLLEGDAESLTQRAIELALRGDPTALKLCIERISPRGRDRPVPFPLPPIEKAADLVVAANWICSGIGTGEISPNEALSLLRVVDWTAKFLRLAQAEKKLQQMESQVQDLTACLAAAESTSGKQAEQPKSRHDAAAKNTSETESTSSKQAEQPHGAAADMRADQGRENTSGKQAEQAEQAEQAKQAEQPEPRPTAITAAAADTSAKQADRPVWQDSPVATEPVARHPLGPPNTSAKQADRPQPRHDGADWSRRQTGENTSAEQADQRPRPVPDAGRPVASGLPPHPWQLPLLATPDNTSRIQAGPPTMENPYPMGLLSFLFDPADPRNRRRLWSSSPGDLPPRHPT